MSDWNFHFTVLNQRFNLAFGEHPRLSINQVDGGHGLSIPLPGLNYLKSVVDLFIWIWNGPIGDTVPEITGLSESDIVGLRTLLPSRFMTFQLQYNTFNFQQLISRCDISQYFHQLPNFQQLISRCDIHRVFHQLQYMKLRNCILKPPNEFNGFNQLVNLELVKVSMSTTLLQNTPLLKKFSVIRCNDIEDEFIYARLSSIFMNSGKVDWLWIGNEKQLKYVRIELGLEVKNDEQTVNMMKFLKNIPKVEELYLDGFSLKYLGTRSYPHKVDLIHSSITHIMVRDFGVDDLSQISSVLCLLKNCPSLMTLKLEIASSANNKVIEPVVEYLEQSNCMDVSLDILQTVSIKFMKDIKTELLLIKLLLARSTCLQRMIIQPTGGIGGGVWLRTSSEILMFPRAASSAQVIYE